MSALIVKMIRNIAISAVKIIMQIMENAIYALQLIIVKIVDKRKNIVLNAILIIILIS